MRFQLDFVLAAEPSDSIESLNTLPTEMESAYDLVMKRIEKRRLSTVKKILSWLFHARRPLQRGELREAVAVRLGRTTLSGPLLRSDILVQYCQGLVTIDETTETVRFSHFTVKEFLYKHYQDQLLSVVDCAKVCLTYMNFDVFEMGPCANENHYKQRREDYQFSEYVVLYWGSYMKGNGERDPELRGILCKFFRSPRKRAAVRQIQLVLQGPRWTMDKVWRLGEDGLNAWTPLHTLAKEGLDMFYVWVMTSWNIADEGLQGIEFGTLHSRGEQGRLPLGEASNRGHLAIVTLMIENGADVCAKDDVGSSALIGAAVNGHLEVVKVLIDNDAEINAKNNYGWTALHGAAANGHLEVVEVLIDNDAEINAKSDSGWTVLHAAAGYGCSELVKMLIDNDAEINAKDNNGWTALHTSARAGHSEVVKVMIDNGAEISAKYDQGWTALHTAAWHGHGTIISLLCNVFDTSQEAAGNILDDNVVRSLKFLTTKFPEDHIFWRALGNEFLRRKMYTEALNSYDTSVRKFVATGAEIDIECLEFLVYCDECEQQVRGHHYKCKSCDWNNDYCQKCVQERLKDHEHHREDLFMIPSQWPLPPA